MSNEHPTMGAFERMTQKSDTLPQDLPITLQLRVIEDIAQLLGELPAKIAWRTLAEVNRAVVVAADNLQKKSDQEKDAA